MKAYLKLFRWPNLLFIIITQLLVRYAITKPFLYEMQITPVISDFTYILMVLATVLISAGGYAINDYFDIRADRINKPNEVIVGKIIPRREVILLHWVLSTAGFLAGAWVSYQTRWWPMLVIFALIPMLLWSYSLRLKKRSYSGNLMIALLTASAVALGWVVDFMALKQHGIMIFEYRYLHYIIGGYTLFAFLTTMVREIVKDMEDVKGDARTGRRTLPVKAGMRKARIAVSVFSFLVIACLLFVQINLLNLEMDLLFLYILLLLQLPMVLVIHKTLVAFDKRDYRFVSNLCKMIMIIGVLSMILVYYYITRAEQLML